MAENHSPETILQEALELSDIQERAAWLDEMCGDDEGLREEVESLLAAHFAANSDFMDTLADSVLQEEPTEQEGDSIGRYKLLQQIGEGGFGTVYLAEQSEPVKRRVALKVIKAGMDTREVIARFEAERQALALMDHPNIAQVHDAGTTEGGRPYFVMELVKGVPLTKYCQDLDTVARLKLFTDVCAAVQHAHQKGIIHRDLKPSNIMVSPHDGKPVVKVIDFGIAKAIGMELTEKTVFTQLGRMIGTPQYMSPEQAELNALDVDTRSDIYSLGVVLYELLTGTTPLDGTKLRSAAYDEMQRMIREDTPQKPSTRVSASRTSQTGPTSPTPDPRALRGDLDWIVLKALEKERTRRYETANALALDVGRHLRDEPVTAGPPSASYRVKKFVRRNRRGLLSGAVAAVALLVGLSVAGGVWLDATLKENQRLAEVEGNASTLIEQAELLVAQNTAADYDDDSHFRQATNLAEQLSALVGIEECGEGTLERRDQLLAAVESERRDRGLIADLEEALMLKAGAGSASSIEEMVDDVQRHFSKAFNDYGTNPADLKVPDTATWLKSKREEVRSRIMAGLAEWADSLAPNAREDAKRLSEIILAVDPNPWLFKLLRAVNEKDRTEIENLAKSPEAAQLALLVLEFARGPKLAQSRGTFGDVLRLIQRENPDRFWANFSLGMALADAIDPGEDMPGEEGGPTVLYIDRGDGTGRPEYDEAIGFLRAAMAARPDAAAGWLNLGIMLDSAGRVDEAVASYQRAVGLKPDLAIGYANLGICHAKQDKWDEATASFRKALAVDPELAMAHHNLGNALMLQGKLDEAVASFREGKLAPQIFRLAQSALRKEGQLVGILHENGAGDPSVRTVVHEISGAISRALPPKAQSLVREFWKDHRELVDLELEQREVTKITLPMEAGAPERAKAIEVRLVKGAPPAEAAEEFVLDEKATVQMREWTTRGGLHEVIREPIFTAEVPGVTGVIDGGRFLVVSVVHASKPGKAERFEEEGVEEAATAAFARQRREQWEKTYLKRLEKRIGEEDAGKPAEAKEAE